MALTPEEQAELNELSKEFGSKNKETTFSAALKTLAAPGTSLPARYKDLKRLLGGENVSSIISEPSPTPNPLNSLQGISEGLFGGFNPYIQGGAKTLVDRLTGNNSDLNQNIEASRQLSQSAAEDNPVGVAAGQGLGMFFNPVSRLSKGVGLSNFLSNHPVIGSGLMSILQGQYQQPLDASNNDRIGNALVSGLVGSGVPAVMKLGGSLANTLFGDPKAAKYLQTYTTGSTNPEDLVNQIRDSQSGIGKRLEQALSKGGPIDVSDTLTPKTLLNEALRLERQGAAPSEVNKMLGFAQRLEGGQGNLSPKDVQDLKSLFYEKANFNQLGVPSTTEKSANAETIARSLKNSLYSKVPVKDLESQYGAGASILDKLNKLSRTSTLSGSPWTALYNLVSREIGLPAVSLLNNTTTGPVIGALTNPQTSSILNTLLLKKISE